MQNWYMLTIIGEDKPGIVAKITQALFDANCHLGEASMIRLGCSFTIMLMLSTDSDREYLENTLYPACDKINLRFHLDEIEGKLHDHHIPDIHITVSGADRAGIVAQVTNALFDAGLDILDLTSDVAGTKENPIYIMQIEGMATKGIDTLKNAMTPLQSNGIDIQVSSIDTLVG